ncbi:MAG: ABC transporter ATP-binding protein [Brevinema sp.]
MMQNALLSVKNLNVVFTSKVKGIAQQKHLIKDVSFDVEKGQCLGILGESGSGKSLLAKTIMQVLSPNFHTTGSIVFKGENILQKDKNYMQGIRGKKITMILQNPMVCFDSLYRIGYQITETLLAHTDWSKAHIHQKSIDILKTMHIKDPDEVLQKYPHQLSGGMLQRIMIGIAIALEPDVIIADEPTTSIDCITRYHIIQEFKKIKNNKTTLIFITHDLLAASAISDKILILKNGSVLDCNTTENIIESPQNEYTKDLIFQKKLLLSKYHEVLKGVTV